MIQQLSLRMLAAMDMVSPGGVADIGTDHGYLAAALALDGKFSPVIATDVAEQPLAKAKEYAKANSCPVICAGSLYAYAELILNF